MRDTISKPAGKTPRSGRAARRARPVSGSTAPGSTRTTVGLAHTLWISLAVSALAFGVYARCLANGFINYDDPDYVSQNVHLKSGLSLETVRWAFTTFTAGNWHPLTWISHAADVQLFGLNPAGHHLVGVLIHAINASLLTFLLIQATGCAWRSVFVAGLFAIHPLNVECVAWAAERKSLLCTLFFLLALAAYGWYARRPATSRYLVVLLLFALGLMAKPMVITLPFVFMLIDFWPLRRIPSWTYGRGGSPDAQKSIGFLLAEKLPLLFLAGLSAWVTLKAQQVAIVPLAAVPLSVRIENAVSAYVLYLYKMIWPPRLGIPYPFRAPTLGSVFLSVLVLVAITVWAWRERRRRPYLVFGWLWYLGTMVPVIGLVQVGAQGMADRYAYIPEIGIFTAIVWAIGEFAAAHRVAAPVQQAVAGCVLLVLAGVTIRQESYWKNSPTLWTHSLQVTRDNAVAEEKMADALMDLGQNDEAMQHLRNATRIAPAEPKAHIVLGTLLRERGDSQHSVAELQTAASLATERDDLLAVYLNLGIAYRELGEFEAAENCFGQVLKLDPSNVSALLTIGELQLSKVASDFASGLSGQPAATEWIQLGDLWARAGDKKRAREAFEAALKTDPKFGVAQERLEGLQKSSN